MSEATTLDRPEIPDHEVIRAIGRGAYGEIWLARSLTGTFRAVKVISRKTFVSEKSFAREFEGMSSFEPVSRSHEGFVDILHVGRGDGFFYYIMELADDTASGQTIQTETYRPKTLRSLLEERGRLPASECIAIGLSLSNALQALHDRGLIHRDIKPSNIIFVHGVPKLADIGLVAVTGQVSFVGTEGYVPPEGPGTAQADIFSLGKVLYEMTMGKDRLDFPEVPSGLEGLGDKDSVMELNQILLRACAAKVKRRYPAAKDMQADLHRLQRGRRRRTLLPLFWGGGALLVLLAALGVRHALLPPPPPRPSPTPVPIASPTARPTASPTATPTPAPTPSPVPTPIPTGNGSVKITSAPGGATVLLNNEEIGQTPLLIEDLPPGEFTCKLRVTGYKEVTLDGIVEPERRLFLAARLDRSAGPQLGEPWTNSLGMVFVPVGNVRFCIWETRNQDYAVFCDATERPTPRPDFPQQPDDPVVLVSWNDAMEFCQWLTAKERAENLIGERDHYRLPADLEWSAAVGLPTEKGPTPESRDGMHRGHFPWGNSWPPPHGTGNYADRSIQTPRNGPRLPGYDDSWAQTSPVGQYPPSSSGLYDLGGNVWEWCLEGYKGENSTRDWGVLRGGSWANAKRSELESSYRNVVDRSDKDVIYGFRCVLEEEENTEPRQHPEP